MKDGPDIARLGSLLGDPARSNMLNALMDGRALTASELAAVAGVGLSTASAHLAQLENGGLLVQNKQGRHRYFSITSLEVGGMLEHLMSFAQALGHSRLRTGPKEPALREARVCYNHLAGEKGVALYDRMSKRKFLKFEGGSVALSKSGRNFITGFGIDLEQLESLRRPLCRSCLDWSERKNHLAGSVGQALLDRFFELGWAKRQKENRIVRFSKEGQHKFTALLD